MLIPEAAAKDKNPCSLLWPRALSLPTMMVTVSKKSNPGRTTERGITGVWNGELICSATIISCSSSFSVRMDSLREDLGVRIHSQSSIACSCCFEFTTNPFINCKFAGNCFHMSFLLPPPSRLDVTVAVPSQHTTTTTTTTRGTFYNVSVAALSPSTFGGVQLLPCVVIYSVPATTMSIPLPAALVGL